jgi:thymidylate synthase
VEIWTDWPLDRYRRETGEAISRADFPRASWPTRPLPRNGAISARSMASNGSIGRSMSRRARTGQGQPLSAPRARVNQVAELVDGLRRNPGSRRRIVEGWNVAELDAMALPPCHKTYQFHVAGNRLSCVLYQRSCDVVLGLPFNLWGAALFVHMLAQQCDLEPGELVWMGGDTHLYLNHADLIEAQLQREPRAIRAW